MSKNLAISVYLDYYGAMLTDKQRDVAELYYNEDLSLGEIAELIGITRQGVHDNIKRTEQILLDFEKSIHLVEKTNSMIKIMEKVNNECKVLYVICKDANCPNKVIDQIDELREMAAKYLEIYN